ncbi:MAG: PAS domain S-box protein, partial [Candidatus Competibacteraceae bacterium]|nr:PAS domain S-box protein [Candidatus Competibacteraceae bacterium]
MSTAYRWFHFLLLTLALMGLIGHLIFHLAQERHLGLPELLLLLSLACLLVWQRQVFSTYRATLSSLRRERDFSNALLDGIPGMVYLLDERLCIRHWNHQVQTLSGYGEREIAGMQATDFFRAEDRDLAAATIHTAFKQGGGEMEAGLLTPSGGSVSCLFKLHALVLDGQPCLVMMGFDISQLHRSQQAAEQAYARLRESEARFRTLAVHAPVGIFEADLAGRIRYINKYVVQLLGRPAEQLLGENWIQALHPHDRDLVITTWQAAVVENRGDSLQYRFLRPNQELVWVFGSSVPLRDWQDNVIGHLGTLVDITALKLAQEQSTLWANAVAVARNGIMIIDATRPGYPILSVNPAYEQMTGYRAQEIIGHTPRFLYQNDKDQPGLMELRQALGQGREAHVVVHDYCKDGSLFWNELYMAPVRDEAGQVTHFVGVQNDITERKQQEAQLLQQAHYDGLTGLPNRELLQDRLDQALIHAQRRTEQVAVLFADLDRFKMINDSLGHQVGDTLLRIVAERLRGCVREDDTVARLGGDEFVIVLEGLKKAYQAARVGEKVLTALQEPVVLDGQDLSIN